MVRDRLLEFQERGNDPNESNSNVPSYGSTDNTDSGTQRPIQPDVQLTKLFYEVTAIKTEITNLKAEIEDIKQAHNKILCTPYTDAALQAKLNQLISMVEANSKKLRNRLKEMNAKNKEISIDNANALDRTRILQTNALLITFNEIMNQYYSAQADFRSACKARITRQLEIANIEHDEEQVEEMIREGNLPNFTPSILIEDTENAKKIMADVEARSKDILKLEEALEELHNLFCEIALLVESQGETISNIALNVSKAQDWVGEGKKEIINARDYQTKGRKMKIIGCSVLAVLVVILCLVLYFTLRR